MTGQVVVIGSGIGGLSAAALLAHNGKSVCVCESHDVAGGAAHEWCVKGFHFESGPSLYAGLSPRSTPNPLAHVFHIIGEEPEWITYDRWGTYLPEGAFAAAVGADDFMDKLDRYGQPGARQQWARLMARVQPLGTAIFGLPSAAVRTDGWAAVTLGLRYAPALVRVLLAGGSKLEAPFSRILEEEQITDPFILHWLDLICFLLQGATVKDAPTTLMAYMLSDFYRPNVALDFPRGGTASIVRALERGVTKHAGCQIRLGAHVETILEADGRAAGVVLRGGRRIRAREAVISNADLWSTLRMVENSGGGAEAGATAAGAATAAGVRAGVAAAAGTAGWGPAAGRASQVGPLSALASQLRDRTQCVGRCSSFLHLHLGIDGTGLPSVASESFPAQWAVVEDWSVGVDAPRNTVLVSMASLLDDSLAPPGCHVIHAYVPATEPYEWWAGLERTSAEYKHKKAEAVEVLWRAIEKQIPDVRSRVRIKLEASPLTHERFLRRDGGSYGPFIPAGQGQLAGQRTTLPGFLCVGDSTFPGIGMPAVAASGLIAANSLVGVRQHWAMLDRIRL